MSETMNVCITGAAGQIAYSLIYIVAKGAVFGEKQKLNLFLLDIPPMMSVLEGVLMEIQDCAFELVANVVATADADVAFKGCHAAFLVGAMPRKEGMERKDLLKANAKIFEAQGKALDRNADRNVKVLVVGNPANTNALICSKNAPGISPRNFTAMTRLDQNRAKAAIAARLGLTPQDVSNVVIWGNHSATQFPDVTHALAAGRPVYEAVQDDSWLKSQFISDIQTRGAAVIKARKLSSAMSAAKAAADHMHDWFHGTQEGQFVSMGVYTEENNCYGIAPCLIFSFPVSIDSSGNWSIVEGKVGDNDFIQSKLKITETELVEERDAALAFFSA